MRIVFLGTGEIGVPALQALVAGHEVVAVYTQPDRPAGRGQKLRSSPVKQAAGGLGLPVFQPEKLRAPEVMAELSGWEADVFVVAAYGQILPQRILDLPRWGCLNLHASLLPRHRGASPIHAAILAGDVESGVTVMQMDAGLDTGGGLAMVRTPIGPDETAGSLHDRLAALAAKPLLEVLQAMEAGAPVVPVPQEEKLATYAPKLTREHGRVDWELGADEIGRRIRGLTPWPGSFTLLPDGGVLKIHQAGPVKECSGIPGSVMAAGPSGILVAAGNGGVLLKEVQIAGARRMAADDFLRGRPMTLGDRLG